jgi:hypothetical protein
MFPDLDLKFKLFPVSILWHKVVTENLHGVINNHFEKMEVSSLALWDFSLVLVLSDDNFFLVLTQILISKILCFDFRLTTWWKDGFR